MDEYYTYTTHGRYDSPPLYIEVPRLQERARRVRNQIPESVKLCAVLKNGNPPGWLGKAMADAIDVNYFCVPRMQDGIALRDAGVTEPIQVMYRTDAAYVPVLLHYDLEPQAFSMQWVQEADRQLQRVGRQLKVHLWIDTGTTREGVLPSEALSVARAIHNSGYLRLQGIATHFCCLEKDDIHSLDDNGLFGETAIQKRRFDQVVHEIRNEGIGEDAIVHAGSGDVSPPKSNAPS